MSAELETTGKQEVEVHYVNTGLPCLVEENFEGFYLEHGDLCLEEVLQDQESVYQSLQRSNGNDLTRTSASAITSTDPTHSSRERNMEREGESSSLVTNLEEQLALDEAVARALQDLENQLDGTSLSETDDDNHEITPSPSSTVTRESNAADNTTMVARQDDIDPDNMTYEELQSLGETVGTQSRGLSEELISYLPSSKYKTGLFSRKDKHEECVICYMPYKNRDLLITLPCQHQYHSKCVTRWLKINKACPVCNEDVFGS